MILSIVFLPPAVHRFPQCRDASLYVPSKHSRCAVGNRWTDGLPEAKGSVAVDCRACWVSGLLLSLGSLTSRAHPTVPILERSSSPTHVLLKLQSNSRDKTQHFQVCNTVALGTLMLCIHTAVWFQNMSFPLKEVLSPGLGPPAGLCPFLQTDSGRVPVGLSPPWLGTGQHALLCWVQCTTLRPPSVAHSLVNGHVCGHREWCCCEHLCAGVRLSLCLRFSGVVKPRSGSAENKAILCLTSWEIIIPSSLTAAPFQVATVSLRPLPWAQSSDLCCERLLDALSLPQRAEHRVRSTGGRGGGDDSRRIHSGHVGVRRVGWRQRREESKAGEQGRAQRGDVSSGRGGGSARGRPTTSGGDTPCLPASSPV